MKKYSVIAAVLVLTATVLTGCRNTNKNVAPTTVPPTRATTEAATEHTTVPTTHATEHTGATEHNGATENHNAATTVPGEHETTNGSNDTVTGEERARAPRVR